MCGSTYIKDLEQSHSWAKWHGGGRGLEEQGWVSVFNSYRVSVWADEIVVVEMDRGDG